MSDALLHRLQSGKSLPVYNECALEGDAELREEILDERARELYGEEHRAVTLSRLSTKENPVLVQRTRKYGYRFPAATNELKDAGPNIQDYQWQYPIPLQVIEANSGANFPQNEGY